MAFNLETVCEHRHMICLDQPRLTNKHKLTSQWKEGVNISTESLKVKCSRLKCIYKPKVDNYGYMC